MGKMEWESGVGGGNMESQESGQREKGNWEKDKQKKKYSMCTRIQEELVALKVETIWFCMPRLSGFLELF